MFNYYVIADNNLSSIHARFMLYIKYILGRRDIYYKECWNVYLTINIDKTFRFI